MQIQRNHEIVGVVRDIIVDKDEIRIIFAIDREIELPKSDAPKEITRELINQRIGLANIDNKYFFRRIIKTVQKEKKLKLTDGGED